MVGREATDADTFVKEVSGLPPKGMWMLSAFEFGPPASIPVRKLPMGIDEVCASPLLES